MATMSRVAAARATEGDLLRVPDDGAKHELVDGQIRVSPAGGRHGAISVRLAARLYAHVEQNRLGHVFDSSTGFRLPGGNVRCPDVSFVVRGRFDVVSPEDRSRQLLDKVGEYLDAGVRLVWVVDPGTRSALVYRSLTMVRSLGTDDELSGEDVVPGFRCRLDEIV